MPVLNFVPEGEACDSWAAFIIKAMETAVNMVKKRKTKWKVDSGFKRGLEESIRSSWSFSDKHLLFSF